MLDYKEIVIDNAKNYNNEIGHKKNLFTNYVF